MHPSSLLASRGLFPVLVFCACLVSVPLGESVEEVKSLEGDAHAKLGDSPAPDAPTSPDSDGGRYVEADENLLTSAGEVATDPNSGAQLPEEANDGELEGGDKHTAWDYKNQLGWSNKYPLCMGKNLRQSPIDIQTDSVIFKPRMQLQFVDYDQEVEFEFKNTHHSVSLKPIPSVATPTVVVNWVSKGEKEAAKEGGEFDRNEFELQEIHFHWGDGVNKGSEHEINDERAAAEMHMVHYRKGLDTTQIGSVSNSVVVVGVFIESDEVRHNKLESLVKRVGNVNGTDLQYKDQHPENLINLLPVNYHSFYTYNGSLTTPPCYEVVTWILLSEPVYMSQEKLIKLANLEANKPGVGRQKISSNHRDIQPLLDRPVYVSFNTSESTTFGQDRIGKRLGNHKKLSQALDRYWRQVNAIKGSFRKASHLINKAREWLTERLRSDVKPDPSPKAQ